MSRIVLDMGSAGKRVAIVSVHATLALMEMTAPCSYVQVQSATEMVSAINTSTITVLL